MTQTTGWRWPWESDPTPSKTPEELAAIQKAKDDALLQRLNRTGWTIVDHAPYTDKSGKAVEGQFELQLAGPNGQPDSVIVDADGRIVSGGGPQKDPDKPAATAVKSKPSPPEKWTTITDANGNALARMDPETGAVVDIPKAPAPRTDTPAETSHAATAASAQTETSRHNAAQEEAQKRLDARTTAAQEASNKLGQARLAWDQTSKRLDQDLADRKLTLEEYQTQIAAAHQQAQDAQAQSDAADRRLRDEQTAQFQQGQLANAATQNTETARSHAADEAQRTADSLQTQQRDAQASLDRQQQTGASLLNDRATHSTNLLNNWTSMASSNKNFGLGGAIDPNMAAGLMSDANTQATAAMGGQSNMDLASQLVHQANPAIAKTEQGAMYTGVVSQMLDQHQKDSTPQFQGISPADAQGQPPIQRDPQFLNDQRHAPPTMSSSPSDPNYLGSVIGAAVAHINERSGLDRFTAPSAGVTV